MPRIAWINCDGLPISAWNKDTWSEMVGDWGYLLTESIKPTVNGMFQNLRLCISTQQVKKMDETIKVVVDGLGYWVRMKEALNCMDANNITMDYRMDLRQNIYKSSSEDSSLHDNDIECNEQDMNNNEKSMNDNFNQGSLRRDQSWLGEEYQPSHQLKDVIERGEDKEDNSMSLEEVNHKESECISAAWKVRDNDQITTSESKNINSVSGEIIVSVK